MSNDALFDLPPSGSGRAAAPADPYAGLSPDARRTVRQREALEAGSHPLSLPMRTRLPLHPDAAPADDRTAPGLRCRDCEFREIFVHGNRDYPKCTFGDGARRSHGAASDVRGWWPACRDYQPADRDGTADQAAREAGR